MTYSTQFSIDIETKDRLDRYKAQNKEKIIEQYRKERRMATNTDVINFLLDTVGAQ